jgi:hypothetical protein
MPEHKAQSMRKLNTIYGSPFMIYNIKSASYVVDTIARR